MVYIQGVAVTIKAAIKAIENIQETGREVKEKVMGVVHIKEGAVYKDPVNTSM